MRKMLDMLDMLDQYYKKYQREVDGFTAKYFPGILFGFPGIFALIGMWHIGVGKILLDNKAANPGLGLRWIGGGILVFLFIYVISCILNLFGFFSWIHMRYKGRSFKEKWRCSKCNAIVSKKSSKCPNCGKNFEKEEKKEGIWSFILSFVPVITVFSFVMGVIALILIWAIRGDVGLLLLSPLILYIYVPIAICAVTLFVCLLILLIIKIIIPIYNSYRLLRRKWAGKKA